MQLNVRAFVEGDIDPVVRLSLRAWEPNFASTRQAVGAEVDAALHPDWRAFQQASVESVCASPTTQTWVAEVEAIIAGFVAVSIHEDGRIGEIDMLAVDPDYQGNGIGTRLTEFALDRIREAGVPVAMVGTGGDPGHAAARRTYEKAGLTFVPMARYFKRL